MMTLPLRSMHRTAASPITMGVIDNFHCAAQIIAQLQPELAMHRLSWSIPSLAMKSVHAVALQRQAWFKQQIRLSYARQQFLNRVLNPLDVLGEMQSRLLTSVLSGEPQSTKDDDKSTNKLLDCSISKFQDAVSLWATADDSKLSETVLSRGHNTVSALGDGSVMPPGINPTPNRVRKSTQVSTLRNACKKMARKRKTKTTKKAKNVKKKLFLAECNSPHQVSKNGAFLWPITP